MNVRKGNKEANNVRYYSPDEHYPFYYIRDYLGNVREVWVHPWANHSECVQRIQYYPSGLPWNEGYIGASYTNPITDVLILRTR